MQRFLYCLRVFSALLVGPLTGGMLAGIKPCHAQLLRIEAGGHTAAVRQVLWSSDKRYLISAGLDKAVRVWDVARGRQARVIRTEAGDKYQGAVFAAALSPGRDPVLVCGGYDVRQWEEYRGDAGAAKHQENRLRFISLRSGAILRTLPGHTDAVTGLAFSPDGCLLASCSAGQGAGAAEITLWDAATGAQRLRLTGHTGPVYQVAFSPDGNTLASVSLDGTARLWHVADGKQSGAFKAPVGLLCAAWIGSEQFATGGTDGIVRLCNARTGVEISQIKTGAQIITALTATKKYLLAAQSSASDTGLVRSSVAAFPLASAGMVNSTIPDYTIAAPPGAQLLSLSVAPDETLAAGGSDDGAVLVWNATNGENPRRFAGSGRPVRSVGWIGEDNSTFAWGSGEGMTAAFDPVRLAIRQLAPSAPNLSGALLHAGGVEVSFENPKSGANARAALLVKQNGKTTRFADDAVRGWEAGEQITSVTLTQSGTLAAVGSDYGLGLYEIESGRVRRVTRFVGHTGAVHALAFSPDGRYLLSGSADQTVRVWNVEAAISSKSAETSALLALFAASAGTPSAGNGAVSAWEPGEWIAWNPSGYYAASPTGDDLVGWQVNRGPERAAVFYTAFAFRRRFYRPDVVRALLPSGSLPGAIKGHTASSAPAADSITQTLQNTPPPQITSVYVNGVLASGTLPVQNPELTLSVHLADASPDTTVSVCLEGRQPKRVRLDNAEGGSDRQLSTTLFHEGINLLTLVAVNKQGLESRFALSVDYRPIGGSVKNAADAPLDLLGSVTLVSSDARAALAAESRDATQHVLVVGVSRFPNSPASNLRYTANDAKTFAGLFPATAKLFKATRATVLTDKEATGERILQELRAIGQRCETRDEVVIYLSSHGLRGKNGAAFYFVPSDFRPDAVETTCLSWQSLLEIVNALPCRRVVLVVDTCHSGGALQEIERGINPVNELLRGAREGGTFAMVSCLPSEVSWEHEAWGMSAFTFAINEAARAQSAAGGLITLGSLETAARRRVETIVREKYNASQTPTLYAPSDMDPNLVPLGGTP